MTLKYDKIPILGLTWHCFQDTGGGLWSRFYVIGPTSGPSFILLGLFLRHRDEPGAVSGSSVQFSSNWAECWAVITLIGRLLGMLSCNWAKLWACFHNIGSNCGSFIQYGADFRPVLIFLGQLLGLYPPYWATCWAIL